MHFSRIFALTVTAITAVSAVTLQEFTRPQCYGAKRLCSNIAPGVCCQSRTRVFVSGNCVGCTSTDFHTVWYQNGANFCGRVASSRHGGGCTGGQNLRGHSWCRLCGTKRAVEGTADGGVQDVEPRDADSITNTAAKGTGFECKESVEPDLITIDNERFFKINYAVPETDTKALLEWMEGDSPQYSTLGAHLLQHETKFDLLAEEAKI